MENDLVKKTDRVITFSSHLPSYRNLCNKSVSGDDNSAPPSVVVSELATPESLTDVNLNSPKKYHGPHALMDPSDPYGMRWTSVNGSTVIDNEKISDTAPLEAVVQDSAKQANLQAGGECQERFTPVKFLRSRLSFRKQNLNRLVEKNGECNVSMSNVPMQKAKYFSDIFTTVVDMKWRWCLMLFAISFFSGWLFFAVVYYVIMHVHGDFRHMDDSTWTPCVQNTNTFLSVFMFSLETQHTIGYGSRFPTEQCPVIVVAICLQSIIGIMIQTLLTGVVFAKLARPKKRAATLIFSKNCCICMRDGKLCLLFRVGDMRKSHLAEAHVRLQMISKRITNEGELLPFHQFDMNVGYDAGLDRIFVVWPITICHVIDENSPLYDYSADDLASARFEIIAILEGVVPSTGSTTQARTSYLPNEVLWGHRFEKLVTYQRHNGEYKIDFSKYDSILEVDTPTLSAKEVDVMTEAGLNFREVYQNNESEQQSDDQSGDTSPSEFIQIPIPQNHSRPSVAEIISKRHTSFEETTNLLTAMEQCKGAPVDEITGEFIPYRKARKMSTLSNRLDRWVPTILNRTLSGKSLTTIKSSGSLTSLSAKDKDKEKVSSLLREQDIM